MSTRATNTPTTRPTIQAEIHTHSTESDGQLSPDELAALAERTGVRLWALTDHDTCGGCVEARAAARKRGIHFINGIEISAQAAGRSVHVLGYDFDHDHRAIRAYAERMEGARDARMRAMVDRVQSLGFDITFDEILTHSERGNLGRPHLARAMHARGYVPTVQEAFDRYLGTDGPAYVGMDWISVDDAIDLIHDAGGLVVLAHPGRYDLDPHIARWVDRGLDGLEIRHPSHDLVIEQRLLAIADRYDLLKTASSDFHGAPAPELDDAFGRVNFPPAWLDAFMARLNVEL